MRHVEERLRRSLTTRADDVRPDPAAWAGVETRLRRRAWVAWSAAGVTVAAALVVAALVLPGLFGQTRVDLSPADPPPPTGATMLVTTDGSRLQVTDLDGEVLVDLDPPTDAAEPLPITRLAVRPGSTPDDLTVVYLRVDDDCERAEIGWVTQDDGGIAGGALGGGQGTCVSDPVWSPDGDNLAWVESAPDDEALALGGTLLIRCWGEEACQGHDEVAASYPIDTAGLEQPQVPAGALRATDWWWELDGGPPDAIVSMSASRADGLGQAYVVQVEHVGGDVRPDTTLIAADPSRDDDASVRPVVVVSSHDRLPGLGAYGYELGVDADGAVLLSRLADDAEPDRVPLDPGVLSAEAVDSGDAWLAARGDTVVFGTGEDAWVFAFDAGSYTALPGVAHAAVMAPPATAPEPAPEPVDFPVVSTDGEVLTVRGPDGPFALADAQESEILDFAVHPASTTDDLTVVWREGRGCTATLHHLRAVRGAGGPEMDAMAPEQLSATCPGRPAFAPDGTHLAWMSHPDLSPEDPAVDDVGLEALEWDEGPAGSRVSFAVQAEQPETVAFDLTDWTWAGGDAATSGTLHLVGYSSHGTPAAYTLPIERQGDGALAVAGGAPAQEQSSILQVASHASDPASAAVDPIYALESVSDDEPNTLQVVRHEDAGSTGLTLPEGLLTVYGGAAETDNVWMTARGDDVLFGDGMGQAWRLPWTDAGWGDLGELDGQVRFAAPVQPAAVEEPADGGAVDTGEDPADAGDDPAGPLPAAVASTREAILEAAAAGDVDRLAELAGEDFTSSFGGPEDPRAFFARLRDEGELDRLVRLLELPHGEQDGVYSWPFAHTRDLESLSSAELELLATVATEEEIDGWFAFGGYAGWRAGIDSDGTWRFYVAGD